MAQQPVSREVCLTAVESVRSQGSIAAAARALGIPIGTVTNRIARAGQLYGLRVEQKRNDAVPQGFAIKGTSTLYDAEGNAKLQWVKTTAQQDREEGLVALLQEAFG